MKKYCVVIALLLLACWDQRVVEEKTVDGTIATYFSAQDGIEWVVEKNIDEAVKSIDVAVYTFTSRPLAQALVDAYSRGVEVRVLLDPSTAGRDYSKATYLIENGIDVRTERGSGLMHHKYALIDDSILINGSFNWTAAAEIDNDENVMVLVGFPQTLRSYSREFHRIWRDARIYVADVEPVSEVVKATDMHGLRNKVGDEVLVKGKVVRVGYSDRSKTYFLNFSSDLDGVTAVIFSSAVDKFEGLGISIPDYQGKEVEISGEIIDHPQYGLEIIIEEPSQVKVNQ